MSKEQLIAYQEQDNFLFHGTNNGDITEFEPRQALSYQKPDGEAAVFAASRIEPAIFMAVLGSRKVAGWDTENFPPPFGFYIAASQWQKAQEEQWQGFVYVFNKEPFVKNTGWTWRTSKPVTPIDKVAVTFADLPADITVLSDEEEAEHYKLYS